MSILPRKQWTSRHAWIYIVIVGALLSIALFMLGRYGFREKNLLSNELPANRLPCCLLST